MRNRKQILADFYLYLLTIPMGSFRIQHQKLYAEVRSALADELDTDEQTVQNIFERMAEEDRR